MSKPISLGVAAYKAQQVHSLVMAILEKANEKCPAELVDLITIACDLSGEIRESLEEATK
ncbi:hypothetical protein AB6F89_14905 [Providencia hangzhouensis]|uniref:hypothetical protein n=1 Tax=Providencia hangzhouensis TaxID=3031799 RepID=UPI0034DCF06C